MRGGTPPEDGRHFGELRADTYGPARGRESGFGSMRTTRGCLFEGNADRPDRRRGANAPEKQAQDNLTSSDSGVVLLGAPWVPTRAAVRVYPAMADGYRLSFSRATRSTRIFAGSRLVSRFVSVGIGK